MLNNLVRWGSVCVKHQRYRSSGYMTWPSWTLRSHEGGCRPGKLRIGGATKLLMPRCHLDAARASGVMEAQHRAERHHEARRPRRARHEAAASCEPHHEARHRAGSSLKRGVAPSASITHGIMPDDVMMRRRHKVRHPAERQFSTSNGPR